jgi:hypothetical protein
VRYKPRANGVGDAVRTALRSGRHGATGAYARLVDSGPVRAIIWLVSFLPVASFTFLVLQRMNDTLPPDSAVRSVFLIGLTVVTLLAAATLRRALTNLFHRWRPPDNSGP